MDKYLTCYTTTVSPSHNTVLALPNGRAKQRMALPVSHDLPCIVFRSNKYVRILSKVYRLKERVCNSEMAKYLMNY